MQLNKLARVESVILLEGESGTGKTTTARKIHQASIRKNKPFIEIDLASLSEQLVESELFGHLKGSFTGANSNKEGYLDKICGGTLFLDEIGEASLQTQKKLLKLIEEKKYIPVGATTYKSFNGTIIAATNKKLWKMVKKGEFRKDLFFRLMVFHHELPKLKEDINFLEKAIEVEFQNKKIQYQNYHASLSKCAKDSLLAYSWPGNYRELKNMMEYLIVCHKGKIEKADLPINLQKIDPLEDYSNYHIVMEYYEKQYLLKKLKNFGGMVNKTAREIGISKVTLISKIKKYDIKIADIKMEINEGLACGL
jgi:transcriptional regulator with PAS, ATPase and Fis domain